MNSINFVNAWLLLIAIPLALVFLIPFFISVRKENRNGHNVASIVMHVVMAIIIAFAAAGTTFTAVLTETQVYVVADVSYSADKNLDTIDSYIKNLGLPKNSRVGLVCFGKDYQLLSDPVRQSAVPSVKTATVDDSQTNVVDALEYAGDLFPDGVIKRIVLITDANQTDGNDDYAIRRAVDALESKNIRVDAIFLDDSITSDVREVQISGVEFTGTVYLNKDERAIVTVESSYATDGATVTLYKDGTELSRTAPSLTEGANTVAFDLETSEAGVFSYEVTVSAPEDKSDKNNSYSFTQEVSAELNILAVTGDWNSAQAIIQNYSDTCGIDLYMSTGRQVPLTEKSAFVRQYAADDKINIYDYGVDPDNTYVPFKNVPVTIEELCRYDEIIIADANVAEINSSGEFINNVDLAVSMFGKTLTTYGNLSIQSVEDDALTALGQMLPVQYGNNGEPRLYAIVIDSSSSMNYNSHFTVAKEVATRIAGLLAEGDQVCIITFYGEVQPVMMPTDAVNQLEIAKAIDELKVQQGTLIGSGLKRAYDIIRDLNYSQKQIMLISDGATFGSDPAGQPQEITAQMYEDGIATSVFDVGRKQNGGTQHQKLLEDIALAGCGGDEANMKYYESGEQEHLSDELFAEIADNEADFMCETPTDVRINRSTDDVLDGIASIPQISGFMVSRQKASATTVLQAEYKKTAAAPIRPVPLFSYWDYGNGKVASFTSRFTGEWLDNWNSSGVLSVFNENVLQTGLPKVKADYPFVFNVERGTGLTNIRLVPAASRFDAVATVEITNPGGEKINENFAFNQYYYYCDFASAEAGRYDITVTYNYHDITYVTTAYVDVPYTDEYNEFASYDVAVLYKALNGGGEVSINGELNLENNENDMGTYAISLTIPLLIICALIYIADIVVRKLRWDDVVSFFGAFKKGGGENK